MPANLENSAVATGLEKSVFIPIPKKGNTKEWKRLRDLLKKIRDSKGIFHAKMGTIKDRNGMDPAEAEEKLYKKETAQKNCTKKVLMTWITMML